MNHHAPDVRPAGQRFGSLVGLLARQWRQAIDLRLQPFDLTEATWRPLVHLARADAPMRQKDLAEALSLDSSSVVRILKNLEAEGLIVRGENEDDRRAKAVAITPAGRRLARRVERVSEDLERELLAGLKRNELASTKDVLQRLSALLGQANARGGRR
ncbi:MAG TPA: MarR family transcriptional regulator [Rhodoblastus sp.]|mgnify:CR=1 FL=1|nr:MarR family transcriptional regulator [Rhodoblastus sp.]